MATAKSLYVLAYVYDVDGLKIHKGQSTVHHYQGQSFTVIHFPYGHIEGEHVLLTFDTEAELEQRRAELIKQYQFSEGNS